MLAVMLERVISGFQTGADIAGIHAARAHGIPTGGAMPKGFLTEDGPRPEFAELYGAVELPTDDYPARTERNVRDSDGTIWFGDPSTPWGKATLGWCHKAGKTSLSVGEGVTTPSHVARWIREHRIRTLNVAGNRESKAPGIGDRVERFLGRVFRRLGHRPAD
jgi:hypothetical protein